MRGLAGADLNGIPTLNESLTIYAEALSRHSAGKAGVLSTEEVVTAMDFYLAFSLFRSAAILQGVYKR